jgi:hypothetical protein
MDSADDKHHRASSERYKKGSILHLWRTEQNPVGATDNLFNEVENNYITFK